MKKIILFLGLIFFFCEESFSQKVVFGLDGGIADASLYGNRETMIRSVMGYNAGFYFEETYNRFLTGQSSLSFIRKGYADRGEESKRMEVNMDYFQFSFLPLFHMKEDTKNKLIAGIGFYIDILVNTKYKNTNEIFIRKYNNSGANIGMKAVLGIEIDKYISVAFQSQIDLNDNFKNVEGTTGSVYVGLNFMIPLFVIQHE